MYSLPLRTVGKTSNFLPRRERESDSTVGDSSLSNLVRLKLDMLFAKPEGSFELRSTVSI